MDTKRHQALIDTLAQIKSRADQAQDDLSTYADMSARFELREMIKLCHRAIDESIKVFRSEEVSA